MKMRTCLMAFLLLSISHAFADSRLDISLEGPWIIYKDTKFAGGNPVLVAIAPNVGTLREDPIKFHLPQITNGNGYYVRKNGIYCIAFDGKCAQSFTSTSDGYRNLSPLQVGYTHPQGQTYWDWASSYNRNEYVTVLILPWPSSFSNDEVWPMRFSNTLGSDGKPISYGAYNSQNTSIQLHYDFAAQAPNTIGLLKCLDDNPSLGGCNDQADFYKYTLLANIDTLHIAMKAPNTRDACDPHVRMAYPAMLNFLDPTELSDNANANHSIAYIDPATDISPTSSSTPGTPTTDPNCLAKETQGSNHVSKTKNTTPTDRPVPKSNVVLPNLAVEFKGISDEIIAVRRSDKRLAQPLDKSLETLLNELNKTKCAIDSSVREQSCEFSNEFPRISQLLLIEGFVNDALERLARDLGGKKLSQENCRSAKNITSATAEQKLACALEKYQEIDDPAKDGKDCRAPLMFVGP